MSAALKLLENNLHQLEIAGQHLLFHIPSTGLFAADSPTRDVINQVRNSPQPTCESVTAALSAMHPAEDIERVIQELKSLDLLVSPGADHPPRTPLKLDTVPLTTLVLNVNTGCNLSCSYCYKEDLDVPSAGKKMAFDVARDAIEMLLQESPDQERYSLVFFGGEPLTNLPLIKQVIDYAQQRFGAIQRPVDFSLTTNATLLSDSVIDYLDRHRVGIAVSMDGPEAFHDRNRLTVGGRGTYATVEKKVGRLLARYRSRPIGARVTLTTGITDVEAIWDHLFNRLGFHEVGFAPVTSGDMASFNLTPDELVAVFDNMKRLGQRYVDAALENRTIGFSNMHQLLTDLHQGTSKALPCGAGVGMVAIDHQGDINLCHRFTGSELPRFGSVSAGVNKPALNQFINQRLEQSDQGCATCRIRKLCAGGCYHESYARYGDPAHPTFHYCELMRDWVDFGIEAYARIMQHNPTFYDTYLAPRSSAS